MSHQLDLVPDVVDKTEHAALKEPLVIFLRYGIAGVVVAALISLLLVFIVEPPMSVRVLGSACLLALGVAAWLLLARGKIAATVALLAFGAWLSITSLSLFNGGVRTPAIVAYPLIVLFAGWLIGARAAWIAAAGSVAVTVVFIFAEMRGVLPKPSSDPVLMHGLIQIVVILLSALLVAALLHGFQQRLLLLRVASRELQQRSHALAMSETELYVAQGLANVGSWSYDFKTDVMLLSAEACRIFGVPEGSLERHAGYLARICAEDRVAADAAWQSALEKGIFEHEHRILVGEASCWIHQKAQFEYGPDGSVCRAIGIVRDISERKKVAEELVVAPLSVQVANSAKSRFLARAGHDLRQPIAALLLYVWVLKNTVSLENTEVVDDIEHCVEDLSVLLADLLDISKLDAGAVTPRVSDFKVDDLLASAMESHAKAAAAKGLRLLMRASGAIVRTDLQLLRRIIGKLLDNAVHFTKTGGVLLACRQRQGKWWIEVWDSGIGIEHDQTGIIFEEFTQLGDNVEARGSGLGLAIVAKTASLLQLPLRVCSRHGHGSLFAVEVPFQSCEID